MTEKPAILLIRLKSIGDVLFTLPAVHLVRENFPAARIVFLTSAENCTLLAGFAEVDQVIGLDRRELRDRPLAGAGAVLRLLRRLRHEGFSHIVDLQGYGETALLTRLIGAPRRWGSVYRAGRRWAYTRGLDRDDSIHPGEWGRSLLIRCGLTPRPARNDFTLPAEHTLLSRKFLAAHNCDSAKPILYLQPFTSTAERNWPLEKYHSLARHWRERGFLVLFSGGPVNRAALEPMRADGFLVAAGLARLTDAGLMKASALVVGGDTGFLHLATALGTRVLMLKVQGSSTGPFMHPEWILAPKAGQAVAEIPLETVLAETTAILAPRGNPRERLA